MCGGCEELVITKRNCCLGRYRKDDLKDNSTHPVVGR